MNIHEYQAKQLFERFGVATPKGIAAATAQEAAQTARNMGLSQYVVKAQVHAGGRGKGTFKNGFKGGVHVVKSVEEVEEVAGKMLNQVLVTKQTGETGKLVSKIMVAEKMLAPTTLAAWPFCTAQTINTGMAATAARKPTPWLILLAISSPKL